MKIDLSEYTEFCFLYCRLEVPHQLRIFRLWLLMKMSASVKVTVLHCVTSCYILQCFVVTSVADS